ncbi:hypothetical protein [Corynebacterium variabile]|uniref:hypothetical protein n=1 Tax=Corynebacterium variabile TaxID=1727 RepID=UPI003A93B448
MTSPTGTTTRQSSRPAKRTVPTIVSGRRRAILGSYIGFPVILVSAVLCFVDDFAALIVWCLGTCFTSGCVFGLRRSTRREDLRPDDELDEYELQRRYRAQRKALTYATYFLVAVWLTFALLTRFRVAGSGSFDTLITTLRACYFATSVAILFVPFMILRSIADGMNHDLLMSGDPEDAEDAEDVEDAEDADALHTTATTTRENPS